MLLCELDMYVATALVCKHMAGLAVEGLPSRLLDAVCSLSLNCQPFFITREIVNILLYPQQKISHQYPEPSQAHLIIIIISKYPAKDVSSVNHIPTSIPGTGMNALSSSPQQTHGDSFS